MIIKEIVIENFICYYGINRLLLSPGLNVILGENGEGKTKLFEAIEWLFSSQGNNTEMFISAKKLQETNPDESFKVSVTIKLEQFDIVKTIKRSFLVSKLTDGTLNSSLSRFEGIMETRNGERTPTDGAKLLEQAFPSTIRKYSMFKGEEELNIFKNPDALINLINIFSDAKHYSKYVDRSNGIKKLIELAVESFSRTNQKNKREYDFLTSRIQELEEDKFDKLTSLRDERKNITDTEELIEEASQYVHNAEALQDINKIILAIEDKIESIEANLKEDYTTYLFDEKWILNKFEPIYQKFSEKITNLSFKRRELQSAFDREQGVKEGEKKIRLELLKNVVPLPADTPSKAIMEEMIEHEICKVCNREAVKGSEPYEFMRARLRAYIDSQKAKIYIEEESEELFVKNFIAHLDFLRNSNETYLINVRSVEIDIKECLQFNQKRKIEISELHDKREEQLSEREKIIGQSSLGAERLSVILKDFNRWQNDLKIYTKNAIGLETRASAIISELKAKTAQKEAIDLTSVNKQYIAARDVIRDIHTIFNITKDKKFKEFINLLEQKSNEIFYKINVDAFTGKIVFGTNKDDDKFSVAISLEEEDGKIYYLPNKSLVTSMHISILMAISEITQEVREESYPLIFDAPTSSFGETKTSSFLNLISEQQNQVLIMLKDFLGKDEDQQLYVKEDFKNVKRDKAFWLKLERPFNRLELKTINTEIIEL